jgi:hypothetical protein
MEGMKRIETDGMGFNWWGFVVLYSCVTCV